VVAVFLVPFHRAEISLAGQLRALARPDADRLPGFAGGDWDRALGLLHRRTGTELAPEQAAAVRLALTEKVAVLTGGPGCGKSFTVRSIVTLAAAKGATIVLAAPTGRAAKRLTQLAGHDAVTVHRLLELRPGGDAAYDKDRPLDADLVVVDEASMLDLLLANKLAKAIPPGAHLLLVGDVDQLPSVGAGEVLRDLLAAGGSLPSVRLTRIFRQAARSGVVTNAHRINAGDCSEYPCVVIPITTSSWLMLQRNLLTRAKQLVVLVGSTKAIAHAVRVTGAGRRHTALDHRLAERCTTPA
jgi:exodeoxyribonuclease V alpha subunit